MRKTFLTYVAVALLSISCASLPAKQVAVLGNQAAGQTIWALQDAERRLCNPVSFDANPTEPIKECAGSAAQAAGLSTEKHQAFAKNLSTAYALRVRLDNLLLVWQPGSPEPAELKGLLDNVTSVLTVARSLAATDRQRELVALGQTLWDEVQKIAVAIRGDR